MQLRRLTKDDTEKLFELRLQALESVPTAFGSSIQEEKPRGPKFFENILVRTDHENVIFGAFVEGRLVGMAGILKAGRLKTNHKAIIWGMFVEKDHRGTGLGAALLDLAIKHARDKMKVIGISISVQGTNAAAKKLYHSRLFKSWGVEPKALLIDAHYYDEEHMFLEL